MNESCVECLLKNVEPPVLRPFPKAVISRVVSDETSERGGVSPPVLGRQPALKEPLG